MIRFAKAFDRLEVISRRWRARRKDRPNHVSNRVTGRRSPRLEMLEERTLLSIGAAGAEQEPVGVAPGVLAEASWAEEPSTIQVLSAEPVTATPIDLATGDVPAKAETVVYQNMQVYGYVDGSGSLGYEDYDSINDADILLETMRFVGGLETDGTIGFYFYSDRARSNLVGSVTAQLSAGYFIYSMTISPPITIPDAGVLEIMTDPDTMGRWYVGNTAPTIGTDDPQYGDLPPYCHDFELMHTAELPDLLPYQPSAWNDRIPIEITQLPGADPHTYTGPYSSDQPLYFNWASGNQGTAPASNYTVRAEVTGTGGAIFDWPGVTTNPGSYTYLTVDQPVGPLSPGSHTFRFWTDYTGVVNESDENNNYYERTITVEGPGAGEIHGSKWHDLDGDQAPTAGEPGLGNWTIVLDRNGDLVWDDAVQTAADGSYSFTGLPAGTYSIGEVLQPAWRQTCPGWSKSDSGEPAVPAAEGAVEGAIIDSPPTPPPGAIRPTVKQAPKAAVMLNGIPTSEWTYGCTATAAGMIFGYYDRTGYPNMYAGPANGGVAPPSNLGQGSPPEFPAPIPGSTSIIATENGFDGRGTNGHVDDYWISYLSPGPDPFEGNWAEHPWGGCTADYLGTNQWKWDLNLDGTRDANVDGSTRYYWNLNGSRLYDFLPPAAYGLPRTACSHGMRLFAESRGYTVQENYTQLTDNQHAAGFTFEDYMAEIDAGYPVLIHVFGHTMTGVGYDEALEWVYLHDTWDNDVHWMPWGGSYADMEMNAVTTIHLKPFGTYTVVVDENEIVKDVDFGNQEDIGDTLLIPGDTGLGVGSYQLDTVIGDGHHGTLDVDIYKISAPAGSVVTAETSLPPRSAAPMDTILRLFDAQGNEVAYNDDYSGFYSRMQHPIRLAGTYYVGVSGYSNYGYDPTVAASGTPGSTGDYRLSIDLDATVEIDDFESTTALVQLQGGPLGPQPVSVVLTGPAQAWVYFEGDDEGDAEDDDDNGNDEVWTELTLLDLTDGTATLSLNPDRRSLGQIEEKVNNTPGTLDLNPFAEGDAWSYFTVYFQIEAGGMVLHNEEPLFIEAEIGEKPPIDRYLHMIPPGGIPLFDEAGEPTDVYLVDAEHHTGEVEIDEFESSVAEIDLMNPQGMVETVRLSGPTKVHVYFEPNEGDAGDDDRDGLDEVQTEMVELRLGGSSSMGPVYVTLHPDPMVRSPGEIEELANNNPGRLDIDPFHPGDASSYFDVAFQINVAGQPLYAQRPVHMSAVITEKPPGPGNVYVSSEQVELVTENGDPTGFTIVGSRHWPSPEDLCPWDGVDVDPWPGSFTYDPAVGTFAIEGEGRDIWDNADDFYYVYQEMSGDGQIVARVAGIEDTDGWAKAGVMMRETLTPESAHAMAVVAPQNGVSFQYRTVPGGPSSHNTVGGVSAPQWVRLVRSGNTFTAYHRADLSEAWVELGSTTITMNWDIYVGLPVTSHLSNVLATAVIDNVSGRGPLWVWGDQNVVGIDIHQVGSHTYDAINDMFTVEGIGTDIWQTGDDFYYAYNPLVGDGEIIARVIDVENTDPWAKAGVMIRETMDPGSTHAMVAMTPQNGAWFGYRDWPGGLSQSVTHAGSSAPHWVRLVRAGDVFVGFESADGMDWALMGTATIPMAEEVYVGLAVTSHNDGELATAHFDNVYVSSCEDLDAIEIDYFDFSVGEFELVTPNGSEVLQVSGSAMAFVYFEGPNEGDANDDGWLAGLDEVDTEMVYLDLAGYSSMLGAPVHARLDPKQASTGEIEETVNMTSGWLDLSPFTAGGTANSYFNLLLEIDVGGQLFYLAGPKHMSALITEKPPGAGDVYEDFEYIPLTDETGQVLDGYFLGPAGHRPKPVVEVDFFDHSVADLQLVIPQQAPEMVTVSGPTTVHVYFEGPQQGIAWDDDGDTLDEVRTEMVDMNLTGDSSLGPVVVRLDSRVPSLGEIEETANNTAGVLDVRPFAPTGSANSTFDLFLEIDVGGWLLYPSQPVDMSSLITYKPPEPGNIYGSDRDIELVEADGTPTGIILTHPRHEPNPERPTFTAPYGPDCTWNVYQVGQGAVTWVQADQIASGANYGGVGGHLASVHSHSENSFLRYIANSSDTWIGLTDNEFYGGAEGNFVWTSGEPVTYQNWDTGQPDDWATGEDATQLRGNGFWNDAGMGAFGQASPQLNYIIEYDTNLPGPPPGIPQVRPPILPANIPGDPGGSGYAGATEVYGFDQPEHIVPAVETYLAAMAQGWLGTYSAAVPIVNHRDPDTNDPPPMFGASSMPFLSDQPGIDDDYFQNAYKGTIEVRPDQAGPWMIGVKSDDGFGLRIENAQFNGVTGYGFIDPSDFSTITFPWGTGDSETLAFVDLAAGEYPLEMIYFEIWGGSFVQLFAAPGDCNNIPGPDEWLPIGAPNGLRWAGASDFVEVDEFEFSWGEMELIHPDGTSELMAVTGPATVNVYFEGPREGHADDDDGDRKEEVVTEMVDLDLVGLSPTLGPVHVGVNPHRRSLGEIEEDANNTPGWLDLRPFTVAGSAQSYFNLYFEVTVAGQTFYTIQPKRMSGTITEKPPGPLDFYENLQRIRLYDAQGNPTDYYLGATRHRPKPPVEIDEFDFSFGSMDLRMPDGNTETVQLTGPATVAVYFEGTQDGTAYDDDGDTFDEVVTEMVDLNLTGWSAYLGGPVHVTVHPQIPSLGEIEEDANNTPDWLDLKPFTPGGSALSHFDLFFQVTAGGTTLYTVEPKRMSGRITEKPPGPLDVYQNAEDIELVDENGNPTGFFLSATRHRPKPPVEIDEFDFSFGEMYLGMPDGGRELIQMTGPATVAVYFEGAVDGTAYDDDDDGKEEVVTEMVSLNLTGLSPTLGPVQVGLQPGIPSMGEIEEDANNTPGWLDLKPFTAGGTAQSHFDLWLQVTAGGQTLYAIEPKRMSGRISEKPPGPLDWYENAQDIPLVDADGNFTGYFLSAALHRPKPPVEIDVFDYSFGEMELVIPQVIDNALLHQGFHDYSTSGLNLHDNGGLMAMTPYGEALLTDGPYGRGLDFNSDADFLDTGVIGQVDMYSNLWIGTLHVDAANEGNWEFHIAGFDDRAGIWIDLDQDGVFRSNTGTPGSNNGESISWQSTGTQTVSLAAGDYMLAFVHGEGGGGAHCDIRIKSPTMSAEEVVKPTDPDQDGFFSCIQTHARTETIEMTGPATVAVYFEGAVEGTAYDDDGDGKEEVLTQMVDLNLTGLSPTLGPVQVTVHPELPSLGGIEENGNDVPGLLELRPFTGGGSAQSHFNLFFQVTVGGQTFYTVVPKRMSGRITEKPPGPLDWYENLEDIELVDANGNPTGFFLGATRHRPKPPVEIDEFDFSFGSMDLTMPDGTTETVAMTGPATVAVYFEGAVEGTANDDGWAPGREEVQTEMIDLNLTGLSPTLGPVHVSLNPNIASTGLIEELENNTPGILDLDPFADGDADSHFDLYFQVTVAGQTFYTVVPKRMSGRITEKPPGPLDWYQNLEDIELVDANGNPTGFFLSATRHRPKPPVEIDVFDFSIGAMELVMPDGTTETVQMTGPATVAVYFEGAVEGTATDDGWAPGREEVHTEMIDLNLTGLSPTLGPVHVGLNPHIASTGLIEERQNNMPGILDLDPFAPGDADSYFDLYFQVTVAGQTFYTVVPKRMSGRITEKPPGPLDWYQNLEDIPLVNAYGNPTGFFLGATRHRPKPPVEIDEFDFSIGALDLVMPDGTTETVEMTGPATVAVYFEGAVEGTADDDGWAPGREEVQTEMIDLNLTGLSPSLGPVHVSLNPNIASTGLIEELQNNMPGILDLDPFADGDADSYFDLYFQVTVAGQTFYTVVPKRMSGRITEKPPGPLDWYQNLEDIPLVNEFGNPTGFFLGATRHRPKPPVEIDEFDFSFGAMELVMPDGSTETVQMTGPATVAVYFEGAVEGTANDDGWAPGREEVQTEMIDLNLTGLSFALGPVHVGLNPNIASTGLIEELVNNTPGILDLDPFADGDADSHFDLYFQVTVAGQTFYTVVPKRMSGRITEKPPGPLDWYQNLEDIPLVNEFGNPTGFFLGATRHRPRPPVEIDVFESSWGEFEVRLPNGMVDLVELSGPTTIATFFEGLEEGEANDDDENGRDEVLTEMVELNLTGFSELLGPVHVGLNPDAPSLGRIEEISNDIPGLLELPPFTPFGEAESSYNLFLQVDVGGLSYHTYLPKAMNGLIFRKPAQPGDRLFNQEDLELLNAYGSPSGFSLGIGQLELNRFTEVVSRHVFYNNSAFDGNNLAANPRDDNAIAPDKVALLPGQTATFANYTSYSKGINGIMLDVVRNPSLGPLNVADFEFRVGNNNNPDRWDGLTPSQQPTVTVRPADGNLFSDRVTLIWPDNVIQKQWLQVTLPATPHTGLAEPEVFYFGNAVGESGNSTTDAKVNAYDMLGARDNQRTFLNPATIDFNYDYNRDARVNAYDMLIARDNQTHFLNALRLITVPGSKAQGGGHRLPLTPAEEGPSAPAIRLDRGDPTAARGEASAHDAALQQAAGRESGRPGASSAKLDWLYEFEQFSSQKRSAEMDSLAEEVVGKLLASSLR